MARTSGSKSAQSWRERRESGRILRAGVPRASHIGEDQQVLFDRFTLVDVARKVVGVGSVGTRCWVGLMEGPDHPLGDPLILQVKEAQPSVLEPCVGSSTLGHQALGRRLEPSYGALDEGDGGVVTGRDAERLLESKDLGEAGHHEQGNDRG
jgi:hypothetical protein